MKQPLPFAFYESLEEQNRFKAQCENYQSNELLIQQGCKLLPFQIRGDLFPTAYSKDDMDITLINSDTGVEKLLYNGTTVVLIPLADIDVVEDADSNSYITYYGTTDIEEGGDCVFDNCNYYLRVEDTRGAVGFLWYSEIFRVAEDSESLVKITFDNSSDFLGKVLYQDGFSNTIYLNVDIKTPKYPVTEDGNENGDKDFIPSFIKWEKRREFSTYAPEYLIDALTAIALHDNINLTFINGDTSKIKDIVTEVDWEEIGNTKKSEGCFANIVFSFAVDNIVVTPCGDNMTITVVPPP